MDKDKAKKALQELAGLLKYEYVDARPAVIAATLGGHPVAVVVALPYGIDVEDPSVEFDMHPAAILLDDDTLDRLGDLLKPPDGVVVTDEDAQRAEDVAAHKRGDYGSPAG